MKISSNLKRIFVSQTRVKLIKILFYYPEEIFYVRELVRLTGEEINSVRRELDNLKKAGVLNSEIRANKLFYWPDQQSHLFYQLLVIANQNNGLIIDLLENHSKVGRIKALLCSYKYLTSKTADENSVDLIIIGSVSSREVDSHIKAEEARRKKEINYMIMDKNELRLRQQKRDPFIVDFFLSSPSLSIGSPNDLT